ncbi:MAG: DUF3300 domain-containing protein [Victivallales bacterium]|jgi:hypothetical protein
MRIIVLSLLSFTVMFLLGAQEAPVDAKATPPPAAAQKKFTQALLEQLVAPIALYPDNLLAQVLAASTYPADVTAARRWVMKNPSLSQDDVKNELKSKKWDPSVQGLVFFPDLLSKMNDNLDWTKDLGDAFLDQQNDLMATVQAMRAKALKAGTLKSDSNQTVTTTQEGQIQIDSASPEVVYVNNYVPSDSYGSWNDGASYEYPNVMVAPSWPRAYYGASWALAYRCAWNNGYISHYNNDYFAYQGKYNANNLAGKQWTHAQAASANAAQSSNTVLTDTQGVETGGPSWSDVAAAAKNRPNSDRSPVAATAAAKNIQNPERSPAVAQAKGNALAGAQSNGDLERAYSDRGYASRSKSSSASNRSASSVSRPAASRPSGGAARGGGGGRR